jgi:exopolyphosphatase/guanosine-5'-triphosphate,3'-diphosphate pyrophosphatase
MTIAALDIGTNSVKLVVAKGEQVLADVVRITRLGAGVDASGRLSEASVERTLAAVEELTALAEAHGATVRSGVGTSALRDAGAAGEEFAARASQIFGGAVTVISGEREAELTFLAGAMLAAPDKTVVVSDIGGGSAEVSMGDSNGLHSARSLQIGAVRLTERVAPSDPWTKDDIERAGALARESTDALPDLKSHTELTLIACGGTAANLAGMGLAAMEKVVSVETIHGVVLDESTLREQIERLAGLTLAERRSVPGIEPDRAEVLVAGAILQRELLHHFRLDCLTVSARGLRYGLLYSLQKENP